MSAKTSVKVADTSVRGIVNGVLDYTPRKAVKHLWSGVKRLSGSRVRELRRRVAGLEEKYENDEAFQEVGSCPVFLRKRARYDALAGSENEQHIKERAKLQTWLSECSEM